MAILSQLDLARAYFQLHPESYVVVDDEVIRVYSDFEQVAPTLPSPMEFCSYEQVSPTEIEVGNLVLLGTKIPLGRFYQSEVEKTSELSVTVKLETNTLYEYAEIPQLFRTPGHFVWYSPNCLEVIDNEKLLLCRVNEMTSEGDYGYEENDDGTIRLVDQDYSDHLHIWLVGEFSPKLRARIRELTDKE